MKEKNKIFFNGLNELRTLAAFFVIFHHIELFKKSDNINSLVKSPNFSYFIERVGKNGVYLFFVLSGFLITYLLLKEKEKFNTIFFKKFYLRRLYRIWPLYYLIVLISFVLIPLLASKFSIFQNTPYFYSLISTPENYSIKSILLYVFFLPNVALDYFKIVLVGCSQTWSVGVEEQFYIIWPLIVFLFTRKKIVFAFILIILCLIFSHVFFQPAVFAKIRELLNIELTIIPFIYKIVSIVPFEFMAIGAIGGYLYKNDTISFFKNNKYGYFFILISIIIFMSFPLIELYFQSIILGFLFLILILYTIDDDNPYVFRNKYFSYLGKISYGIYMYHPFIMFLVFPFANKYFPFTNNPLYYNIFVYFFVFTLTILVSNISYKYFESVFIKIKDTNFKSL